MRGFFKWFGLGIFGAVAIAVCLYTISWLMPIPAEDAKALALVEAPRPLAGRNGFAALWSLKYDVPVAEAERLLARESVRFRSLPAWSYGDELPVHASALDAYPSVDTGDGGDALCGYQEERCLRHVRGHMGALAPVMAARSTLDARVAAIDNYDYFHSPFPPRLDMPIPSYQPLLQTQTAHAYAFALGDHDTGLRGVCGNASIARKLVASGDNLIGSVIGVALMDMSARLFVEMLAELPADYPLPDACASAFEADGAMVAGICPTMIGEGKYIAGGLHALNGGEQPWHRKLKADLFFDLRKTMAKGARRHA